MSQTTYFNVGGVPEHFNLPWHQAIEQGLFEKESITIKWTDYPGGTGAMAKDLRSGQLDIAVLLTEGIVADIVKGNDSKIVQLFVATPLIWGIHVPGHSSFQNANELQGKRYAISRMGSGSHLMAFVDAVQRGWNPQEQQLVLVGDLNGAREAFKNNQADVFMWEKFMTKPLVDTGEFRRVGECPTPWPCFVIAARAEVLASKGNAIKKLVSVINQASQNFKKSPDAVKLVAQRYGLQPEDAQAWFGQTQWANGEQISEQILRQIIKTLFDLQVIDKQPEPASLLWK